MMRKRRKPTTDPVSLFPFLAVLICTMGALVMLLVLAVKAAEQNAEQSADETITAQKKDLENLNLAIESKTLLTQAILDHRDEVLSGLSDARKKRGHIEEQLRQLEEELAIERANLDQSLQFANDADHTSTDVDQKVIEQLKAKIADGEQKLSELKSNPVQPIANYRINVGPTKNGTNRLPIFIECTDTAITFQPAGVTIKPSDISMPLTPGNPIDAALLAVREYYVRAGLTQNGDPYPLIVVRPGGETSYAIVRRAMLNWDDEFGYELVEADREIDFGHKDEGAKQVIECAIDYSRQRMARRLGRPGYGNNGQTIAQAGVGSGDDRQRFAAGPGNGAFDAMAGQANGAEHSTSPAANGEGLVHGGQFGEQQAYNGQAQNSSRASGTSIERVAQVPPERPGYRGSDNQANDPRRSGDFEQSGEGRLNRPQNGGATSLAQRGSVPGQNSQNMQALKNAQSANPSLQTYVKDAQQWYQGSSSNTKRQGNNRANTNSQAGNSGAGNCPCLADSRGQDWALPSVRSNGTAYRRPIYLHVTEQGYGLPSRGSTEWIGVADLKPESSQAATDKLVKQIWDIIDSWGYAGADSYWKPELQIKVHNGGEDRFEMLNRLLDRSGLDVKRIEDQ